jgi:hypothetical protein
MEFYLAIAASTTVGVLLGMAIFWAIIFSALPKDV